jgi:two-component system, NtrC family, sensor histidine kinase HydH
MDGPTEGSRLRRTVASDASRICGVLLAIVTISIAHGAANGSGAVWHGLLLRLYYIPILVGAYWYGAFGGLLVAMACSVAYVPHLREQPLAFEVGRYAEIVVFHVIGLTVGLLATAQRHVTERYRAAAETLQRANRELRDSYEHLQRADRLKTLGEIAAGLAHEIRHPLASIRGALEIIGARSQPDSPEGEFSRLAMTEVQRLDNLIWEFLRYARPHLPELRPASLPDLVDRVVTLLRVEGEQAGVRLDVGRDDTMPTMFVDSLQIEQVLLNVLLNAIQASPPGSCVRVRARQDRQEAVIDVVDDGPGIPAEHVAHIFSPFFTTREKGTGLGLAIAQRIVVAHRGHIEVHRTPDRGACIRIRLPLDAPTGRAELQVLQEQV